MASKLGPLIPFFVGVALVVGSHYLFLWLDLTLFLKRRIGAGWVGLFNLAMFIPVTVASVLVTTFFLRFAGEIQCGYGCAAWLLIIVVTPISIGTLLAAFLALTAYKDELRPGH